VLRHRRAGGDREGAGGDRVGLKLDEPLRHRAAPNRGLVPARSAGRLRGVGDHRPSSC